METGYLSLGDTVSKTGIFGAIIYLPLLVIFTDETFTTLGLAFFALSIAWFILNSVYFRIASRFLGKED